MTTDLAALAASLGHEPTAPEWDLPEAPVSPARFGKDHWSTFAYVETRAVDYKGAVDHDHLRCAAARHPLLLTAKRRAFAGEHPGADRYPTRLQEPREEIAPHDDYDCMGDLVVAGLLAVEMPHADGDCFIDPWGWTVLTPASGYTPGFLTGLAEGELAAHARWSLTPRGHQVAGALRAHKAAGNNYAQFRLATVPAC